MNVLILETTCDETSAAVVNERREVLGYVVASQERLHEVYDGVVPELASRAHLERLLPVVDETLRRAKIPLAQIDAVAVAHTPGLAGSLLVGVTAAKAFCLALGKPLVGVNHLQAHIYACRMAFGPEVYPCVGLVVSGGHTNLYRCTSAIDFELLGSTIDDAAGEAFDKVAILLGLGYPGGPRVEQAAASGSPTAYAFPRSFIHEAERLEFSFSGLKTAVRYQLARLAGTSPQGASAAPSKLDSAVISDVAASFQAAVVDVLVAKCQAALKFCGLKKLCIGGGVAANKAFRTACEERLGKRGNRVYFAPPNWCADNAVMGAVALERVEAGLFENLDLDAVPGLVRSPRQPSPQA